MCKDKKKGDLKQIYIQISCQEGARVLHDRFVLLGISTLLYNS